MSLLLFGPSPWVPVLRLPDVRVVRAPAPLSGQIFERRARSAVEARERRHRRRAVRAARRRMR